MAQKYVMSWHVWFQVQLFRQSVLCTVGGVEVELEDGKDILHVMACLVLGSTVWVKCAVHSGQGRGRTGRWHRYIAC